MTKPDETVSMSEAARLLGVSRQRVYQLVGMGFLRTVKRGRQRVVPLDAIKNRKAAQVLHAFDEQETITFINGDARPHDMRSDPHPAHTDCPALSVGPMMPGERREIAGPKLPGFTLCYYHDELDPTNSAFRGVVVTH